MVKSIGPDHSPTYVLGPLIRIYDALVRSVSDSHPSNLQPCYRHPHLFERSA